MSYIAKVKKLSADVVCAHCGTTNDLHAHHIEYRSNGGTDDLSNQIVLCESCHIKVHQFTYDYSKWGAIGGTKAAYGPNRDKCLANLVQNRKK